MKINLHIERLVLEGLPLSGDRHGLQAAVETQVAKTLAATGTHAPLRAIGNAECLRAPPLRLEGLVGNTMIGSGIGEAICDGLGLGCHGMPVRSVVNIAAPLDSRSMQTGKVR